MLNKMEENGTDGDQTGRTVFDRFMGSTYHRSGFIVTGIILLGLLIRVWGMQQVGLSHDESLSHYYAMQSAEWILRHCASWINHPPLFFLLLHGWLSLVPPFDQFWVEMPNVIFGTATVFVFYWWSRVLFSRGWSLVLVLVFSLHPFHVYYSTVLRMYCLGLLGLTCAGFALTLIMQKGSTRRRWGLWILGCLVALYSHSFTGLFVAVMIVALGLHQWQQENLSSWAVTVVLLLVLYLPWFNFVVRQTLRISQNFWIPDFHPRQVLILGYWFGGFVGPKDEGWFTVFQATLLCITFFVPVIWSLLQWKRIPILTIWAIVTIPIVLVIVKSTFGQSVFLYRTFLFSLPFVIILWALGIQNFIGPVKSLLVILFIVFLGWSSVKMKMNPSFQYAKGLPGWIRETRPENSIILHAGRYSYFASIFYNRYELPEYLYGYGHRNRANEDDVHEWRESRPVLIVYSSRRLHEAPVDRRMIDRWKDIPDATIKKRSWKDGTFSIIYLPPRSSS